MLDIRLLLIHFSNKTFIKMQATSKDNNGTLLTTSGIKILQIVTTIVHITQKKTRIERTNLRIFIVGNDKEIVF